jgi:hypothetical protein
MMLSCFRPGRALPRALFVAGIAALAVVSPVGLRAQEQLPPARTILDRHVTAIGGKDALLAHSSIRITGTISLPASGISGTLEAFAAKPNKVLARTNIQGIGELLEGVDGKIAWSLNPMTGPMLSQGKELEQKMFDADFHGELRQSDKYKSTTTVEKTTWEGRPAYKVRLVRLDDTDEIEYYDVENGFRIGREFVRESPMGSMKIQQVSADYRKFGDLMFAATSKVTAMNVQQVITIASVEYDKVDPAVFEPPAAIKALVKAPAGK